MAKKKAKEAPAEPVIDKDHPAKPVAKGPKTVNPAWLEKIAECGAMHHLATEGVIVAKPMVDFKGTDLIAFTEQTGVLGYIQVKGRQTANKKAPTGDAMIPTDKMTPIALDKWIDEDELWFIVIFWMQEEVFLVFTGKELVSQFMGDDGPKLLYKVGDIYKFKINKAKLAQLKEKRQDVVGNFRKIADALMGFPIEQGTRYQELQAKRYKLFSELEKAAQDAYRNSSANKSAKDALSAASVHVPADVQSKIEEGLPDDDDDTASAPAK